MFSRASARRGGELCCRGGAENGLCRGYIFKKIDFFPNCFLWQNPASKMFQAKTFAPSTTLYLASKAEAVCKKLSTNSLITRNNRKVWEENTCVSLSCYNCWRVRVQSPKKANIAREWGSQSLWAQDQHIGPFLPQVQIPVDTGI